MTLPLSKTLDPADFAELVEELKLVDRSFTRDAEQHPMRRWEYAMALRAENAWRRHRGTDVYIGYDIGGAGSPFRHMASVGLVVDPAEPPPGNYTLEQFVTAGTELASIVFCLSVLEHVDDLSDFCYHLSCLVAPGGLLFLTMDTCDTDQHTEDRWHFHWMRKRIFSRAGLEGLLATFEDREFGLLDHVIDWRWHGAHVYDYSFCSLALIKRS